MLIEQMKEMKGKASNFSRLESFRNSLLHDVLVFIYLSNSPISIPRPHPHYRNIYKQRRLESRSSWNSYRLSNGDGDGFLLHRTA
jgi:hypothetical protein